MPYGWHPSGNRLEFFISRATIVFLKFNSILTLMINKNILRIGILVSLLRVVLFADAAANNINLTYPWALDLFYDQANARAVLISHDLVLISGHMLCDKMDCTTPSYIVIKKAGSNYSETYKVHSYTIHPYYRYRNEWGHDLAIIKLEEAIALAGDDFPELDINTYSQEELLLFKLYSICGYQKNLSSLIELEPDANRFISTEFKGDSLVYRFNNNALCGPGDSGSPLFYFKNEKPFILGAYVGHKHYYEKKYEDQQKFAFYPIAQNIDFLSCSINLNRVGLVTSLPECHWQNITSDENMFDDEYSNDTEDIYMGILKNRWLIGGLKILLNIFLMHISSLWCNAQRTGESLILITPTSFEPQ